LTSLFQSEHLSLLVGAGLTHAVHYIAANELAAGMENIIMTQYQERIDAAAAESARKAGREEGNLEDQLRVANELLRGLEILGCDGAEILRSELEEGMKKFAESILESEAKIATAGAEEREKAFTTLVNFLMSFASRTG
jgi:hypothetical protein